MTQLSNAELAQKLTTTVAGWQDFVEQQLAWLTEQTDTVTIVHPYTNESLTAQTLHKLVSDYEDILGPNPARVEAIEQYIQDFAGYEATLIGLRTAAEDARDDAQAAESTAQGYRDEALSNKNAAQTAAGAAATSESNAATSASDADASATAAETSASQAAADASSAASDAANASASASSAESSANAAQGSETAASQSATEAQGFRDEAETFASQAETSANNAATSEANAATSEVNAATSASDAATSLSNINDAETNAVASASAAAVSESNADSSASAAAASESAAATSATQAQQAKDGAEAAEVNAQVSAAGASGSASAAASSALDAQTSADDAATSEANAQTHATAAQSEASAASSSASAAATSETNASNSAAAALSSELSAATSESNAATSASDAANSAQAALASENASSASETAAANSESAAATSASEAEVSKVAAEAAEINAEASATAAATSESNANASATAAQQAQTAAETAESNAESSATAASASASAAATSESNAATSETNAQSWAEADYDTEVEPGQYSAYHWAVQAQLNSSGISSTDDLSEGTTNLYWIEAPEDGQQYIRKDAQWLPVDIPPGYGQAEFDTDFGGKTTDDLTEGASNKYWKEAPNDGQQYVRKDEQWSPVDIPEGYGQTEFDTDFGSKTTDDLTEGPTNLYFTDARAVTAVQANSAWQASNWDTAYSWGNHADAGYLTSFTESDPTVPSHVKSIGTADISNWDTAFSWGDHSAAGYQPASTAITTSNIGSQSVSYANDAGSLDGVSASGFLRSNASDTASGHITFTDGVSISGEGPDTRSSELIITGDSPQIGFNDTGSNDDFYIHINSNNFYVLADRGGSFGAWDSPHPLQLEADTNKGYLFGDRIMTTAFAASRINGATGNYGSVRVDYERGNYAGYAIRDDWVFMSHGADLAGIYNDTDNDWAMIFRRNSHTEVHFNGSRKLRTESWGVRVDGLMRATNNVTAYYSDERLKDFHGTIDSPLEKLSQINGYYFTENERAKELGYCNDQMQIGVNAQEVQKVFPEVIDLAPISLDEDVEEDYLTVHYDKLVPVLIEAVKEQQKQIDELKELIHGAS